MITEVSIGLGNYAAEVLQSLGSVFRQMFFTSQGVTEFACCLGCQTLVCNIKSFINNTYSLLLLAFQV